MRHILQPGPPPFARAVAVPAHARPVSAALPAGRSLLEALVALAEAHDGEGACLSLSGGALGPFVYVMPAASPDAAHAAFYSAPFHPDGPAELEAGAVTLGWRDGRPFFHAHAIWREADGARRGGHLLPEATMIAAPIAVSGVVISGARFEAVQDPETGFRLFEPVAGGVLHETPNALALRLRPNQDVTEALEAVARGAGFRRARIAGGVGSLIGARFASAPEVEPFATEMFLTGGELRGIGGGAPGLLHAALVDMTGALAEGAIVPGENPVLMTLEAVVLAA